MSKSYKLMFTFVLSVSVMFGCSDEKKSENTDTVDTGGDDKCPIGSETCPCTGGGVCDSGLTCLSGVCVNAGGDSETDTVDTDTVDTDTVDTDTADTDTVDTNTVDTDTVDTDTADTDTVDTDTIDTDTVDTATVDTATDTSVGDDTDTGVATGTVWVSINGGTFDMGGTTYVNQSPVHAVTVPSFEMLQTEVTAAQYEECVTAGSCTVPGTGSYATYGVAGKENNPVNYVNWQQAVDYCTWIGGRLPSEAEWEYAARSGGQDITYPWGDETATCSYAVMSEGGWGCGTASTMEVCSKTAGNTDQGLCDMAGNVWEWVQDWYHSSYTGAPTDGSAWDDSGSYRVRRGGSFSNAAGGLRAAYRSSHTPTDQSYFFGFRCAK